MIVNTDLEHKGNLFPSKIVSYKKDVDTLYFSAENNVVLELTIVRDSVLRFRYTTTGTFEKDFSYAITKYASTGYNHLEIDEDKKSYKITTSKLICNIQKSDLKVSIFDVLDGKLINQDELGFHWEESYQYGGNIVKMSKQSHDGECYFGMGDKPVELNLKGKRFENWVPIRMPMVKELIQSIKLSRFTQDCTIKRLMVSFLTTRSALILTFPMNDETSLVFGHKEAR
jgi:alpha-glucosidase